MRWAPHTHRETPGAAGLTAGLLPWGSFVVCVVPVHPSFWEGTPYSNGLQHSHLTSMAGDCVHGAALRAILRLSPLFSVSPHRLPRLHLAKSRSKEAPRARHQVLSPSQTHVRTRVPCALCPAVWCANTTRSRQSDAESQEADEGSGPPGPQAGAVTATPGAAAEVAAVELTDAQLASLASLRATLAQAGGATRSDTYVRDLSWVACRAQMRR
jgi:hypothetical protein